MSKTQKQAAISEFITFPLAGATLGGIADYAFSRKLKKNENKVNLGKKTTSAEEKADAKENARRLLRSLILGGGMGLGVATMLNGGTKLIESFYGVPKSASYKRSKLLAKLVKKANGDFFSNPVSTYATVGGASLLSALALYHFLNDKKKRNLGGYIGSGLAGLGAGLAATGLYNKGRYGSWLGTPESANTANNNGVSSPTTGDQEENAQVSKPQTIPAPSKIDSTPIISNIVINPTKPVTSSSSLEELDAKKLYKKLNSPEWKSFVSKMRERQTPEETPPDSGTGESEGSWGLGWWVPASGLSLLGGLGTGVGKSWWRNRIGDGTPQDLLKRQNRIAGHKNKLNSRKHPLVRRLVKGFSAVTPGGFYPAYGWGSNLGDSIFGREVLGKPDMKNYTLDPKKFNEKYTVELTPYKDMSTTKNNQEVSKKELAKRHQLEVATQKLEAMINNATDTVDPRVHNLLERVKKQRDLANSGYLFSEMTNNAKDSILKDVPEGARGNFDLYTYQGPESIKDIIEFEQARAGNKTWYLDEGIRQKAEAIAKSLPEEYRTKVNQGRFAQEASQIKSPIEGLKNTFVNDIQKAYKDYIRDPADSAKYTTLEDAVNKWKAIKNPETFENAGYTGDIAGWKYTDNPELVKDINSVLDMRSGRSQLEKEEALDVLQRVKDLAPENIRPDINQILRMSDIMSSYKGQRGGMPKPLREALSKYDTAKSSAEKERIFNDIENMFINDMAEKFKTSSTDLSQEFRNKINSGEYPHVQQLVEDLDRLNSKINALEQFSDNYALLNETRAEYTNRLNTLLKLIPTAGNTVKSQLLRGRVAARDNAIKGYDFLRGLFNRKPTSSVPPIPENYVPPVEPPPFNPPADWGNKDGVPPIPDDHIPEGTVETTGTGNQQVDDVLDNVVKRKNQAEQELSPEEQVEQWDEQQRQIAEEADQEVRSGNTKRLTYQELRELGVPKSVAKSLTKPKPKPATVEDALVQLYKMENVPKEAIDLLKDQFDKLPPEEKVRIENVKGKELRRLREISRVRW